MNYLTLSQIKQHLNLDASFGADDQYLTDLGNVAELSVEKHIDYPLSAIVDSSTGKLPMPIIHAMLLLVGSLYMNRESVSFGAAVPVPHSYDYLISLYQNYDHITKFDNLNQ